MTLNDLDSHSARYKAHVWNSSTSVQLYSWSVWVVARYRQVTELQNDG